MDTRTESDLLGSMKIDSEQYYGIHTARAIENFKISTSKISDYPHFISALVLVKKSCALANKEIGVLSPELCHMIVSGCDQILKDINQYKRHFPSDAFQGGAGTSVNMNANEVIANVALEIAGFNKGDYDKLSPMDHVNMSQSTNDVYPTALRVALHIEMDQLMHALTRMITRIDKKAAEFQDILKMGRTQLQDAIPMSLGQEFSGWSSTLHEEVQNLRAVRDLILDVNLGATAIGTGANAPNGFSQVAVGFLSELSKLSFKKAENLVEATSDCGAYVMIAGALKRTAVKVSKICNDLRLLSSGPRCGLNEINLPQMQAGSSIMPAKVNPVIPEVVNQVCFKIFGNDVAISFAAEAGQLQLNVMAPLITHTLFESLNLLNNACYALTDKCIVGITANEEHSKDMVMNSVGIVTFLAPYIGHEKGDEIGKEAIATQRSVREIVLERGLLTEEKLEKIFAPENLMRPQYKPHS